MPFSNHFVGGFRGQPHVRLVHADIPPAGDARCDLTLFLFREFVGDEFELRSNSRARHVCFPPLPQRERRKRSFFFPLE